MSNAVTNRGPWLPPTAHIGLTVSGFSRVQITNPQMRPALDLELVSRNPVCGLLVYFFGQESKGS